jgi:hypothetical protein
VLHEPTSIVYTALGAAEQLARAVTRDQCQKCVASCPACHLTPHDMVYNGVQWVMMACCLHCELAANSSDHYVGELQHKLVDGYDRWQPALSVTESLLLASYMCFVRDCMHGSALAG